ncbi:MAG: hypothetical protein C4581_06340 [Nitrospiraceae bacterium]|nr:MAG: hypothetical protein C4581_06340 [Nitrospiraceae bacterium]
MGSSVNTESVKVRHSGLDEEPALYPDTGTYREFIFVSRQKLDSRLPDCVTIAEYTLCVIPANAGISLFQALSKCIDSGTQAGMTIVTQSVRGNDNNMNRHI